MRTLKEAADRCIEVGECLIWNQSCNSQDTPMTYYEGRTGVPVPRVVYCISRNVPMASLAGLLVWAKCKTLKCCNHEHLRAGTRAQWCRWRVAAGLTVQTPQAITAATLAVRARPTTKLSMEAARRMRALRATGATFDAIGRSEGVCGDTARKVIHNVNWREASRGASVFNL